MLRHHRKIKEQFSLLYLYYATSWTGKYRSQWPFNTGLPKRKDREVLSEAGHNKRVEKWSRGSGRNLEYWQKTSNTKKRKKNGVLQKQVTKPLNIKKYRPPAPSQIWEWRVKATGPQKASDLVSENDFVHSFSDIFCTE